MSRLRSTAASLRSHARTWSSSVIFQQAGWLALAKIVQGVSSLLATLLVARSLGPSSFGQLSLAIAVASFVASGAGLGLEHIATRELAAAGSGSTGSVMRVLRRLRLAGGAIGAIILLVLSQVTSLKEMGVSALLVVLSLLPISQIGDVAEWRMIAARRSRTVAMIVIGLSPLAAVCRVLLALSGAGVIAFAWTLVAEWATRSGMLALASREDDARSGEGAEFLFQAQAMLKESAPLLISGMAVFIYMRIDQLMIASMLGSQQLGLYSAVVTLAEVPLILPALLLRATLPQLTKHDAVDPAKRDRILIKLMALTFYGHVAVSISLALAAGAIVTTLYGAAYADGAAAFRIQVMTAPFVALGVLSSAWLVLERRTSHALHRTAIGAFLNIGLNFLLIPRWGIAGAATATLVAQIIATFVADAFSIETRPLFMMKCHALLQRPQGQE